MQEGKQSLEETLNSLSERERIKPASFPFDGYLIRVSMEKEVDHFIVGEKILAFLLRR